MPEALSSGLMGQPGTANRKPGTPGEAGLSGQGGVPRQLLRRGLLASAWWADLFDGEGTTSNAMVFYGDNCAVQEVLLDGGENFLEQGIHVLDPGGR